MHPGLLSKTIIASDQVSGKGLRALRCEAVHMAFEAGIGHTICETVSELNDQLSGCIDDLDCSDGTGIAGLQHLIEPFCGLCVKQSHPSVIVRSEHLRRRDLAFPVASALV